ncbi:MAG: N-acetylmuramoyl-L-alanine amidase, partial [Bacteroidota bacterium]
MIINPFFWRSIPWLEILTKVKEQQIREAHQARYCWCLDNGHGILTQGKRSPVFDGQQLLEYEFNLDIVDRIIEQLEAKGVTYYRTIHRGEQLGNALRLRVKRANEHKSRIPKLFVSIHANAGPARSIQHWADDSISGIETWHHDKSGTGIALARIFQRELVSSFPDWKNRGLRHKSGQ